MPESVLLAISLMRMPWARYFRTKLAMDGLLNHIINIRVFHGSYVSWG